jgi:hypothetical protein
MIATSLCQIPSSRKDGQEYFDWILYSYDLGPDRKVVEQEMQKCGREILPARVAFTSWTGQGGAAGVRSKLYYWVGRKDAAINSEPVKIVNPKSEQELNSRIYPIGQITQAVEAAKGRMGKRFKVVGSEHFIIASGSNQTEEELREMAKKLDAYLQFFISEYGMREPSGLVTVYLVPYTGEMQKLARDLHGMQVPEFSIGYSFRDDLSIVGVIPQTYIGTLAHELAHLLIRDKYGDLPPWLDEGFASLYEVSTLSGGKVRGDPNWRGCVLQRLWREDYTGSHPDRPTIDQLLSMDWRGFNNLKGDFEATQQAVNHAAARYFILYLQDRGLLNELFVSFARRAPLDVAGDPRKDAVQRIGTFLGSDLKAADDDFEKWLINMLNKYKC